MKKLQLCIILFTVLGVVNVFAGGPGETFRNSPTNPNARKQQLAKVAEGSGSGRHYTKSELKKQLAANRALAATTIATNKANN